MAADSPRFRLSRLTSYEDADLVAELKRAAALLPDAPLTVAAFNRVARASGSVCQKRFGGWLEALSAAGLEDRYSGRTREWTDRGAGRGASQEEMIAELQRVAASLGTRALSQPDFDSHSQLVGSSRYRVRFGSWRAALEAAGLEPVTHGRRWTDDDYYENLLTVWTHYGQQPSYGSMDQPPSCITSGAYESKFGTWRKALLAFLERVNADPEAASVEPPSVENDQQSERVSRRARGPRPSPRTNDSRTIRLGLRYQVLRSDNFRCVLCGASPAITHGVQLHVDHIVPVARGGRTVEQNLRTLCGACNLGKGSRVE